ncbi:hypothetical protein DPMN_051664 [Dreissena polymorpha]|uniref:Uncharacterized protein n=1 Tax=Dreissena polymorpha TaxID=45954 RepID=A0A9D4HP64_DREPO|nr:hypothetical protein DPMN_051664 [Dreissena polymorpha]
MSDLNDSDPEVTIRAGLVRGTRFHTQRALKGTRRARKSCRTHRAYKVTRRESKLTRTEIATTKAAVAWPLPMGSCAR